MLWLKEPLLELKKIYYENKKLILIRFSYSIQFNLMLPGELANVIDA